MCLKTLISSAVIANGTNFTYSPTSWTIEHTNNTFMNMSSWIDWGNKMLDCYESLSDKIKEAYSFIPENKELLQELSRAVNAVRYVEKICKNEGFSIDTCRKCQKYILHNVIGDANNRRVMLGIEMLEYFKQEKSLLLDCKQKDNISSGIIESDFG